MGAFIGYAIAALIVSFLVYVVLHRALFKRIVPDPFTSRILAAVSGYLVSATLAGFGTAGGDGFRVESFTFYLVPALVVLALAIKKGRDERIAAEAALNRATA